MQRDDIRNLLVQNEEILNNLPRELLLHRNEFKNVLAGANETGSRRIFATGHQIEFFHPGILFKETEAARLAREWGGIAITFVLDNDPASIRLDYPLFEISPQKTLFEKKSIHLGNCFFKIDSLNIEEIKSELLKVLSSIKNKSSHYQHEIIPHLNNSINIIIRNISSAKNLTELITESRIENLQQTGSKIHSVYISDLIHMKAWKFFTELIIDDIKHFRLIYNNSVANYRKLHKIKNHAQPVPDLKEDEFPFWTYYPETSKRTKSTSENITSGILLPRAITLSLFFRIFACDLFIHGAGGGKYDEVTSTILADFFHIPHTGFLIRTATLKPDFADNDYFNHLGSLPDPDIIKNNIRFYNYHPEKLVSPAEKLFLERIALINEKKSATTNLKLLHQKLEANRAKLVDLIHHQVAIEEAIYHEAESNKSQINLLNDRTLPYFFYNWNNFSLS